MGFSVVVATFGAPEWAELARARAIPSACAEGPLEVIVEHGTTLAEARNRGAARARGEWLVFLDADDELEPGYLEAIASASGDLRAPAVRYVTVGEPAPDPLLFTGRNIARVNPCVIGTALRRDLFDQAGGFWTEPVWEDWSLFRRAWLLGAQIEHVPGAVYRVNVNPDGGRNDSVRTQPERDRIHRRIIDSHTEWKRKQRTPQ